MKRPHLFHQRSDGIDSTMTPMIDVVFLLLVFFVWTASFYVVELVLPSELSVQPGKDASQITDPLPEQDFENVVVKINWDGSMPIWLIDGTPIASVEQVRLTLEKIAGVNSKAPLIVAPMSEVPLGYVIEVYDIAKMSGFEKVSFAINQSS